VGTFDDVRISGPIGDPNFYGQLLLVVLPLALDRMWGERTLRLRIAGGGAAALIAAATVFTFSRGAALALGAVLLMMAIIHRPSLRSIAVLAVAAVMAIPVLPPGYLDRLLTLGDVGTVEGSTDASIRGRTAELKAGWIMFVDHPLNGVGFGLYEEHYQDYVAGLGIELRSEPRQAHSFVLEVAAETGLPGLAAMGAIIGGALMALRRARRRFRDAAMVEQSHIAGALAASIGGYLITGLFLHHDFPRIFWLLMGISYAVGELANRVSAEEATAEEVVA
jgi:O-antigen ligase